MKTIHAIYENGVLRPTEPVDLPEKTLVEVELRSVGGSVSGVAPPRLSRHVGVIKTLPVDPLDFQRRIREEWD